MRWCGGGGGGRGCGWCSQSCAPAALRRITLSRTLGGQLPTPSPSASTPSGLIRTAQGWWDGVIGHLEFPQSARNAAAMVEHQNRCCPQHPLPPTYAGPVRNEFKGQVRIVRKEFKGRVCTGIEEFRSCVNRTQITNIQNAD